jgi:hypothetical protein
LNATSASPLKADVRWLRVDVQKVPIAEVARLFDHLVSPGEQDRRNRGVGLWRFEIISRWNGISVGVHEIDRKLMRSGGGQSHDKRLFSVGKMVAIAFNAS